MKILEAQNSALSNFEVYQHLASDQSRQKGRQRRRPGNLATLVTEVLKYLGTAPSPLHDEAQRRNYDTTVVSRLLEKLSEANLNQDLAKGEVLMVLNLRPSSTAVLSTIVDDMEERFSEHEQNAILDAIAEVLGREDPATDGVANDTAMSSLEDGA